MPSPKIETTYAAHNDEWTRLLIIAPPKVGKTFTTATTSAKDPKKVLMVLADEGGARTLRTHRVPCARTFIPAGSAYMSTVDLLISLKAKCPYEVVVIDSISMLQAKVKAEIMRKDKFTTQSGKEDNRKLYGKLLDLMRDIIMRAHDLPCDVIWTAWLREPYESKMGGALVQGQSADLVEGNVDGILCLERVRDGANGWKYQMRTRPFFFNAKADKESGLDASGQVNCNNRLGLPDPFPANIRAALEYDTPVVKAAVKVLPKPALRR